MFARDLILLDYETTGPSVRHGHEPVQVGAVRLDRVTLREVSSFTSFVRPLTPHLADPRAFQAHGIRVEELSAAPEAADVVRAFEDALLEPEELAAPAEAILLAAHNAPFDRQFHELLLERAGVAATRHGYHYFCTWTAAAALGDALNLPLPSSLSLDSLCAFLGVPRRAPHDALADARASAACLRALRERAEAREAPLVQRARKS